jgi:6-phosphogluconolactonase
MADAREIRVLPDTASLFQAGAKEFASQAETAIKAQGRFAVALSGGSTPRGMFSLLAANYRDLLPWDKMFFFWSDERHVPQDSSESNYRMAHESLLSKVPVPQANIFRVPAEKPDAVQVAAEYEETVRRFFQIPQGTFPQFDLILLGMGPDGHTASLFPETSALHERDRLVVSNRVEKLKTDRITFTAPLINRAKTVMFLIVGSDKAQALREVMEGNQSPDLYPSKLIHPLSGRSIWLVDQAAAASLSRKSA